MRYGNQKATPPLLTPIRLVLAWLLLLSFLNTALCAATWLSFSLKKTSVTARGTAGIPLEEDLPEDDFEPYNENAGEEDGLNDHCKVVQDADFPQPNPFCCFSALLTGELRFVESFAHLPDPTTGTFSPPPETIV